MIYFDASVLLSLLVADGHTDRAGAWYSDVSETIVVSDLANLEVSAVLSRDLRSGRLSSAAVEAALLDFEAMRVDCKRMGHSGDDFVLAERIVRNFATKLAAPDALHLATAKNAGASLATFDTRLAAAASAYAVGVVRP